MKNPSTKDPKARHDLQENQIINKENDSKIELPFNQNP